MSKDRSELISSRRSWMIRHSPYTVRYWQFFDFDILKKIPYIRRGGQKKCESFNDVIIMLDSETSKERPGENTPNYIVAWTLSIRAFGINIVTLYGTRPSECVETINRMIMAMPGDKTVIYVFNLSYDWVFFRKFFLAAWGTPVHQLNTKPHYPLFIDFQNGLCFKDAYILAQRSLDKWASDLDVEHKKAGGKWDYNAVRMQGGKYASDELEYIEHDTLAGVECIDKTMQALRKKIYSIPHTATGIPREIVQRLAKANHWREQFLKIVPPWNVQQILECCFHGGYTHNNRHYIGRLIHDDLTEAYDEASAYPFVMLTEKFPMERFTPFKNCTVDFILHNANDYAYAFKLILIRPRLRNNFVPMPALQKSKCVKMVNAVDDNGRILCADYAEIYLTEIDLEIIREQYIWDNAACVEVHFSRKDYLPKWFSDFVYKCFMDKTQLKGVDAVLYSIAKAKLNSLYGMCVQRPVKQILEEDYQTGSFSVSQEKTDEELYDAYIKNYNSVLPYQWGVWVTSYAFRNLFRIGSCAGLWLYSDTDSCYGQKWDKQRLDEYNAGCREKLTARGYGAVRFNDHDYWLGVAELDGVYSEFVSVGAKRYAVRKAKTGDLKITVAGVPKIGVRCLNNDLKNFRKGFIFDGETTGKLQHTFYFVNDISIDENGNERGDSIDLSPADYLLGDVEYVDWEKIFYTEVTIQVYDESGVL